jgi:uncharacterized RDD family membrane protein YckC
MIERNLQGQYAGFVSRAMAYVLDLVISITIVIVVVWVTIGLLAYFGIHVGACPSRDEGFSIRAIACWISEGALVVFAALFWPAYTVFFLAVAGQTLGKRIVGVRVVRLDGRRMTFRRALLRLLGYYVSIAALGLGFLWILVDNRRQGWQDKIARTCVVYAWPARQNEPLLERVQKAIKRSGGERPSPDQGPASPSS